MGRVTVSDAEIARARRRGEIEARSAAKSVRYLPGPDLLRITLRNGTEVLVPRNLSDGLRGLPRSAARELKVGHSGNALTIEHRDVHISVRGLIRKATMGEDPFARAGRTRSRAKADAARANGRRGGRPPHAA